MHSTSSEDPTWYHNRQRRVRFNDNELAAFIRQIGSDLARGKAFAVLIASDASVRQANRLFRKNHSSTDVLSFPDGDQGRLGDILISATRAERQAWEHGHRVEDELKVLVLHGLLHLLGYDHEVDKGAMRRAETHWGKKYGLTASLIEREEC